MKKSHLVLLCWTAGGLAAAPVAAKPGDTIPGHYICVFKPGAVAKANVRAEANRAASAGGGRVTRTFENSIRGFSAHFNDQAAGVRRNNPNIAYCEQDQEVGLVQSALEFRTLGKPAPSPPAQKLPWGVARVKGGLGVTSDSTAFVIDSGIDLDHPDLVVDVPRSRSFLVGTPSPDDANGHGSHVAGIIAARADNGIGVIGVVPGAKLVAVRVLDRSGRGSNSGVINGVDYVAGIGVAGDVANMSLGGGMSQALDDAVVAAAAGGVSFTLAAGNSSASATNYSPARAEGRNVYTVSAFADGDVWASYSNYDNPPIDYAEPGSAIYSTYKSGGYATLSGTSMAAPHLAGLLLGGAVRNGGTVNNDPDGTPDIIGVH